MPNGDGGLRNEALKGFREEVLGCRDGNHAWNKQQYSFEQRDRVVTRTRRCTRCTARQTAVIVRTTGEYLVRPKIEYPEGYLAPKGTGRISKQEVRRESVRRVYVVRSRGRHETEEAVPARRKSEAG
jgi:hypothetical protein